MTALTAESLRRLAELGTRSPLYGPGVASVSRSEYAISIAASMDKDDWDVSSRASTEAVVFDRPAPTTATAAAAAPRLPPVRRAMTDVADDDSDCEERQQAVGTSHQRRRASECVAPAPGTLRGRKRAATHRAEPKNAYLGDRLKQARAELFLSHSSVAGSDFGDEQRRPSSSASASTAQKRARASSIHHKPEKPEKPLYLQGMQGMPDWDGDAAAVRSPSSRPQSMYSAYRPGLEERAGSPDLVDLTCRGSLHGGSVPTTPIDPEAMCPADFFRPPPPPSPKPSSVMSAKSGIITRGRRLSSKLCGGGNRSKSRSRSSVAPSLAPTTTSSSSIPVTLPSSSSHPPSAPPTPLSPAPPPPSSSSAFSSPSSSTRSRGRPKERTPQPPLPPLPPSHQPPPSPSPRDRSRSRSRSRSPGAGAYVEDPAHRRSFIDRTLDRAETRISHEVNKHLVRAGRRPRPSFQVRGVSRSPVEDIATGSQSPAVAAAPPPVPPKDSSGRSKKLQQQQQQQQQQGQGQGQFYAPYRAGVDRVENDVAYRLPGRRESEELFGISVGDAAFASAAGLFERQQRQQQQQQQIRRKSTLKLVIDTKLTASPVSMPAAIYDDDDDHISAAAVGGGDAEPPKTLRRRRNRTDSLFLGSDISMKLAGDSFFPPSSARVPPPRQRQPPPQPQPPATAPLPPPPPPPPPQPQQHLRPIKPYRPPPPPAELEAAPVSRIADDDNILPDRPLDLGVRPSSSCSSSSRGDEDDRGILPSRAAAGKQGSPSPFMLQRRTLNRKAGNRHLKVSEVSRYQGGLGHKE